MNILYATAEAKPFIRMGDLGDLLESIPLSIHDKSLGCRIVIPLYSDIPNSLRNKMKFITSFQVPVGWRSQYCGIFESHVNGVIYYFIDNEYYFKRSGIYGHSDDLERFAFFSRAVLEMLRYINYPVDIIHSNEWHTALIPIYKKLLYKQISNYENIKTVFTIHNITYQGQFGLDTFSDILGLNPCDMNILEFNGLINLMKAAIITADSVTTTHTYVNKNMDNSYAYGLENIIKNNSRKLCVIANGIDTKKFNPETDEGIIKNYSIHNISDKTDNKTALQKMFHLPVDDSIPVIGMITNLVEDNGLDLIRHTIEDIICNKTQFVLLGSGDPLIETFFVEMANRYPAKMGVKIGSFPDIASKIYAGADMFLMTTKEEPCCTSHLIALRYGTIPIVKDIEELEDIIIDSSLNDIVFTFDPNDKLDIVKTIRQCVKIFHNKEEWNVLVKRAMNSDNSWQNSADKYIHLYKKLVKI